MFGIKVNDTILSLKSDNLTYDIYSPINFGVDTEEIKNGIVYSLNVPNNDHNALALGHPFDIQRREAFLKDAVCEIIADGNTVFAGFLTVTAATWKEISISIKIATIPALKDTDLATTLPIDYAPTPSVSGLQMMLDSATYPQMHPFICFPVFNHEIFPDDMVETTLSAPAFQNFYDIGTDSFVNNSPFTPFLRINYLLDNLFTYFGYTLTNSWQLTDELKKLVFYNNVDQRITGIVTNVIHPKQLVPSVKCSDFLRKLCRVFNLAYKVDIIAKTAEIFPLNEVRAQSAATDWTDKWLRDEKILQDRSTVKQIRYQDYEKWTGKLAYYTDYYLTPDYYTDNVDALGAGDPAGYYYDNKLNGVYYFAYPAAPVLKNKNFDKLSGGDGTTMENTIFPALNEVMIMPCTVNGTQPTATATAYVPYVRVKMTDDTQRNDMPLMLMLYRGFQNTREDRSFPPTTAPGKNYPMASANVWNVKRVHTNAFDRISLYYNGENGLGIRSDLANWLNWLNTKSDIEGESLLTVADLKDFDFRQKVRIGEMEYFVRRLLGNISTKSISRVKVELVSAI